MLRFTTLLVGLLFLCGWTTHHPDGADAPPQPVLNVNLMAPDISGVEGTTLCVPISATGFDEIVSAQFSMTYDASVLQYTTINPDGMIGLNPNGDVNATNPGQIGLAWSAPGQSSATGVTVAPTTPLFEVCFNLIGAVGANSTIAFGSTPLVVEIADKDFNVQPVSFTPGTVTVTDANGGTGGGGSGNTDLTFTFGSGSGACNTEVCVDLSADNFTDVISAQFTISYDETVLDYDHAENFSLPLPPNSGPDVVESFFGDLPDGELTFSWNSNAGYTAANGQTLFSICFNLIGGANDISSIQVTSDATPIEIANSSLDNLVPASNTAGQITITSCGGGGGGSNFDDFTLIGGQVSADPGASVCVPVTVGKFVDIISMQFSMGYDPAVLQYSGVNNINVPGLAVGDFSNPQPGQIGVIWTAMGNALNTGVDLPDNTVLFEICFTVIGDAGNVSSFDFTTVPTAIEVAEVGSVAVPVVTNSGSITINGGGGGGGGPTFDNFTFIFDDISALPGENVCIPVEVANFEDIIAVQFSIGYNPAVLQFTGLANVQLPGLGPTLNDLTPGQIGFLWTASTAADLTNGVDFTDGTAIVEFCFDVIGSTGQTSGLQFTNTPTPIDVADNNQQSVQVDVVNATFTVGNNVPDPDPLGISIPTYDADAGGSVCFPVQVTNFDDITDLNFSICFDPTVLSFTQIINLNIPGVSLNDFSSANGTVSLQYDGNSPINLLDNTTVFDICFNVVGAPNTSSSIDICNTPVGISVTNDNGQNVPVNPDGGQVNVQQGCSAVSIANASVTNAMCNGEATGAISLTLAGGDANNTISWSNGQSGTTISGLTAGTYTATVSSGCDNTSFNATYTVSQPASALLIAVDNITVADQGNNGSIDIAVSGGTPGYSYQWSNGATTQDINGLAPGSYFVTVTDLNSCTQTASFQVSGLPLGANITATESCQNSNSGTIDVQPVGGTANYNVTFSPQSGTVVGTTLTNAPAGTYTVIVNDGQSTYSENVTIGTFAAPTVDGVTVNDETGPQTNDNGSISITLSGGTTPYTVAWSNGATGQSISGLDAGTYSATITDGNGCQTTVGPYTVGFQPVPLTLDATGTDVACNGDTNGSITAAVMGGDPNYEYTLTYPDNTTEIFMTTDLTPFTKMGLPAGMYVISVVDANGQGASMTIMVEEPEIITTSIAIQPETDAGTDGNIFLDVAGGTPGYTYQWSNGATTQNLTDVAQGCYDVTVTDANGCEMTMNDLCVGLLSVTGFEVTNALCESALNGSIDLSVAGGTGLTYQWFNQNDELVGTGEDLDGIPAGTYYVVITDASGQTLTSQDVVVIIENNIDIEAVANTDFNGFEVSCGDESNGSIQVEAVGGTGAFAYLWSTGDTTKRVDNLPAGTYSVTVSNLLGGPDDPCFFVDEITISAPTALAAEIGTFDASCFGDQDGELTANVSGGVAPYTFAWSDGQTTATATDLNAGEYTLTVTDGNGCELIETATVGGSSELVVNVITTADETGEGGAIDVRILGGTAPYTLTYSEGINSTESIVTGVTPGDYMLTVSDANGCETTVAFTVTNETDCLATRLVITPDADGLNETFVINCTEQYANNHLEIYNRFGQLIFEMDDYDNLWNGVTNRGSLVDDGVYFFVFEYDALNGAREQLKGHITVIRE